MPRRPHVNRAAHAPAGAARASASTPSRSSTTSRSSRTPRRSSSSSLHVPAGDAPRGAARASSSRRSRGSRAPGTTGSPTSSSRATATPRAGALAALYAARLPDYYKTATPPELALADIELLERVAAGEPFAVGLQNERAEHTQAGARPLTRVDVATHGGKMPLSASFLPVLEALGLTVMEEVPTRLDGGGRRRLPARLRRAASTTRSSTRARRRARSPRRSRRSGAGDAESDTLNALVVARRPARGDDVVILRAYRRYRRSVAPTFTDDVPERRAVRPPGDRARCSSSCSARASATRAPTTARERTSCAQATRRAARRRRAASTRTASCAASSALIDATVRTNACARPRPYLLVQAALGRRARRCRSPRPLFEIFVYHPRDGGHPPARRARSRAAASAGRTGARTTAPRCSGLMKAQMVKNAVIVPVGAKGGFVLQARRRADRDALRDEVRPRSTRR